MRICLLGGSGFVGRNLAHRLHQDHHEVIILSRNPGRETHPTLPGCRYQQVDPYDSQALARTLRHSDAVVNLVGILNEAGHQGHGFQQAHVRLLEHLLEACQISGVRRFLQMSALGAGQAESHYSISKGQAESLIQAATQRGLIDATIFRPSVIFGREDQFINRFAQVLHLTPVLPLARPQAQLQPVWVRDVVEAFAQALSSPHSIGACYPLVGPQVWTLQAIVQWIAQQLGLKRWIIPLPDTASRLQGRMMDYLPGKPYSSDNDRSLQKPNISTHNGLTDLGITAHSMQDIVPAYLCPSDTKQQRLNQYRQHAGR
ncbi:MAG: complex I NDUFA9 subunit family protein [Xanthomonadales bacterium]|nr:complex I NDUFA9 subunit family protein [Xanthomonadales bacterium]